MEGETRRRPGGSTTTVDQMQATMLLRHQGDVLIGLVPVLFGG
jgi:hypothetical protein